MSMLSLKPLFYPRNRELSSNGFVFSFPYKGIKMGKELISSHFASCGYVVTLICDKAALLPESILQPLRSSGLFAASLGDE